ncbi:hypothetical protein ATERTT37_007769 [Aspergillus terreus]
MGSSYLSAQEYAKSIRRLMHPKYHIPHRLRELFRPRHPILLHLSHQFKAISEDMKLWTFLETVDSTLTVTDSVTNTTVEMHVPITSIRSGLLDLEHEKEVPLATDHVGTATFKGQEQTTRLSFIKELQSSVAMAVQLSTITASPLHVGRETMVQVNGFFEDTARGVSDETPLKLWSTKTPLREYLKHGPSLCLSERLKRTGAIPPGSLDESSGPKDPRLAIYLHWDTYWNLLQRRKVVEERLRQGRSRPAPDHVAESTLESKLIWKFLGSEPPIHIRRTLDQYGYPNLRSTVARDDDQMLWKRTKKTINLSDELRNSILDKDPSESSNIFIDGKVLMVDQLWLWIVDQKTVVTFFPRQEATTAEGKLYEQANLYNSIYNELNGDLARRFETAGDLAALIVLHAVTILLDRTLHHDLQVLRIFEESISILTESMTKSFKRFRNRGFITRPDDYNKTLDGKTMTAAEKDERDHRVASQNREDLSALLELRDIVDELGTIMKLLEEQTATVKIMAEYFEDKGYGRSFIESALSRLDQYRTQVSDMKENAYAAQRAVETLLDLKQKQANVDESRLARWEAEVTQNQSQSVMVFTIFTVIFLPLSFFTSLFGINVREWSGEPTNLTMSQMLSIAVIVFALLMAFSDRLREAVVESNRILAGIMADVLFYPLKRMFHREKKTKKAPSVSTQSTHRRDRFSRYRRYQKQLENDIWKRHEDRVISPLPPVPVSEIEDAYTEKVR